MARRVVAALAVAVIATGVGGCACGTSYIYDPIAEKNSVTHVILLKLKDNQNAEVRRQIVEATKGFFGTVSGLGHVSVGRQLVSGRPEEVEGFDVGIVMRFKTRAALEDYQKSEAHQKAVRDLLGPNVAAMKVADWVNE